MWEGEVATDVDPPNLAVENQMSTKAIGKHSEVVYISRKLTVGRDQVNSAFPDISRTSTFMSCEESIAAAITAKSRPLLLRRI